MRTCRTSESAVKTEITLKTRHGALVPVELLSRQAGATNAEDVCYHTAIVDLTDRRKAEEEHRRAEEERASKEAARAASDAKDRFLAMLSHELRTPLTPILFALAAFEKSGGVPEALRPTLRMIARNIALEARLIDDLLDVTRIARDKLRLQRETVDVHAAVHDAIRMLEEEFRVRQVQPAVDLAARAHHVSADPARVLQVLSNLVKNAVRHTPPGGRVTVASANPDPAMVRLSVTDTGVGIEPAALGRIFDLFEQAEDAGRPDAGLGIGLAVCKGIVEAHAGRIAAASEGRGRGARFDIELATVAPPAVELDSTRPERPAEGARRILLVEDNPDNALAMSHFLGQRGYEVTVAGSVHQALELARDDIDLVISDIGLPDGSGHDLVRQLVRRGPVRAIALSGYGAEIEVNRSAASGFERHLTKPIDPEQLIDAIEGLLPRRNGTRDPEGTPD
jgi:signal transduction histidine kinase/ActR/RegA family two-component response regulator